MDINQLNKEKGVLLICSLYDNKTAIDIFSLNNKFFKVSNIYTVKQITPRKAFDFYIHPNSIKRPSIPAHDLFPFLQLDDIDIERNMYTYSLADKPMSRIHVQIKDDVTVSESRKNQVQKKNRLR